MSFLTRLLLSIGGLVVAGGVYVALFIYVALPAHCVDFEKSTSARPDYCDKLALGCELVFFFTLVAGVALPWIIRKKR